MAAHDVVLHAKPRRHYTVDGATQTPDGLDYVGVTTALGILDKPALVNWAAWRTCEGAFRMLQRKGYRLPPTARQFQGDLKRYGLDHNSDKDDAAARGTAVHKALEAWIGERKVPAPGDYAQHWAGYFRGLSAFLIGEHCEFLESELSVCSTVHGFAGTRDTVAVGVHSQRGRVMLDLKTSKRVYPGSHFPQLEAYEIAGTESGEEPTDARGVVRLGSDGSYEVVWSTAVPDDFLAVLAVYRSQQRLAKGGQG